MRGNHFYPSIKPPSLPAYVGTPHSGAKLPNPGLAHDMIAVTCSRRYLSEVRICMGKDLAFHACPETDRRACRNPQIAMPPVRGG